MGMIWESYWSFIEIILGFFGNDIYSVSFVLSPNFSDLINSCILVVSEKRMWSVVTLKAGEDCELKQEASTLATELRQPLKLHNRERMYFFRSAGLDWNCS